MVEIPEDADVNHLKKGDARHGNDEDHQMTSESEVPVIGSQGTAQA